MAAEMRTFVLLHGAWHTGKCWEGVVKRLTALGHKAVAPTLPGHEPEGFGKPTSYRDYVDAVVDVIHAQESKVTLVGHSSAGHLIQAAASHVEDKLDHLVFHNAFVLGDGQSQFDIIPPDVKNMMSSIAQGRADRRVPHDEGFVRHVLMGGNSKHHQDAVLAQLVPQPVAAFDTPVATQGFQKLKVSRSVVFATEDTSLPPGAYLGMASQLGDFKLIQIPGGHESLFVDPDSVADALASSNT